MKKVRGFKVLTYSLYSNKKEYVAQLNYNLLSVIFSGEEKHLTWFM